MHNAAFAALRLPHRYEALAVSAKDLGEIVRKVLRQDDVLGANVTIPHKEQVGEHLDEITETGRRIGAVNTIYKKEGRLVGDNTDVAGFAEALAENGLDVAGKRVLVLGAGGAAKACVDHLLRAGALIYLANRTPERATGLVEAMHGALPAGSRAGHAFEAVAWPVTDLGGYDVVVNSTSLGLHSEDPLAGVDLPSSTAVVDIIGTSVEVPLVRRARAAGCVVVDGLLILLYQGVSAFRLWTGRDAPVEVMRAALPRAV